MIEAVVFDLDGVLVDSEGRWDAARRAVVAAAGRPWCEEATRAMQGMSAPEWTAYLRDELQVPGDPEEIGRRVVAEMLDGYRAHLPLVPGAVAAVESLARVFPLGLASSSNREVIDAVLDATGIATRFAATVSSEEVARGKPSPDVYLETARRLRTPPESCAAIEDSSNGLRSAAAAGMAVVAVPSRDFPPAPDALALAGATVDSLVEVTPALIAGLAPA